LSISSVNTAAVNPNVVATSSTDTTTNVPAQTPVDSGSGTDTSSPSSVVTLSDTSKAASELAAKGVTFKVQSLAAFFAPAMYQRADSNGDGQLSNSEFDQFATQAGNTKSQADASYNIFNTDGNNSLTMDEFDNGVAAATATGDSTFTNALNALMRNPDGTVNIQKFMELSEETRAAAKANTAAKESQGGSKS
jgi:hypothetical protein